MTDTDLEWEVAANLSTVIAGRRHGCKCECHWVAMVRKEKPRAKARPFLNILSQEVNYNFRADPLVFSKVVLVPTLGPALFCAATQQFLDLMKGVANKTCLVYLHLIGGLCV